MRIVVIDSHPLTRLALCQLLLEEDGLEICGEASTQQEALDTIRETQPNMVIVDMFLDEGSGVSLIKEIVRCRPSMKVLVLSRREAGAYAKKAVELGVCGYLSKREETDVIIDAIRSIALGLPLVIFQNASNETESAVSGVTSVSLRSLTARELEVFEMLSRGLSNRDIAGHLCRSVKTINAHRENIKMKLRLKNSNELIRRAVTWFHEN